MTPEQFLKQHKVPQRLPSLQLPALLLPKSKRKAKKKKQVRYYV
ncbi:hypothetical protein ciss_18970 [Carboxydothermus islandicus]|uniref:Uncharacterized protein n=1 Tax=Carboxydothermus islandicus TaxID=661089 RepID=A0A1L8D4C2_9THEO|nr:hypothetical protein [Carboxydothermus islandicus]GAV25964.1 hypothetical protein ciss_18970 [Carboxydothermus islandicus]